MEKLPDPKKDRQYTKIEPPVHLELTHDLFWLESGKPNWKQIMKHLKEEGKITKEDFIRLIKKTKDLLSDLKRKGIQCIVTKRSNKYSRRSSWLIL